MMESTIEKRSNSGLKTVLKNDSLRRLLLASMVNRFGDSIDVIAMSWLVFQLTHSPSMSALVLVFNYLPTIFLQPLAGAAVERRKKKRVIVLADCGRGLLALGILAGLAGGGFPAWIMLVVTFAVSSLEAFRNPSLMAFIPELLQKGEKDLKGRNMQCDEATAPEGRNSQYDETPASKERDTQYDAAVVLMDSTARIMELVGTGAAGILVAAGGVRGALLVDVVCFAVSVVLEGNIRQQRPASYIEKPVLVPDESVMQKEKGTKEHGTAAFWKDFREGFQYIKSHRLLLLLLGICAFLNAVAAPLNALQAPLVSDIYNRGSETLSVMGVILTLGMFLGALLYQIYAGGGEGKKVRDASEEVHPQGSSNTIKLDTIFLISGILNGIFYGVLVALQKISMAGHNDVLFFGLLGGACLTFGSCVGLLNTAISAMLMKKVPASYMSRVFAWVSACATAAVPGTSLLLSGLLLRFTVTQILAGFGILVAGVTFFGWYGGILRGLNEE